ncbi:YCF48-related protein [Chloroflexota bacterium]
MKEYGSRHCRIRISLIVIFLLVSVIGLPVSGVNREAAAQGEATWSVQLSALTRHFRSVFFYDSLHGWAVGDTGSVIRSVDGGDNWSVELTGVNNNLRGVYFINTMEGWLVGDEGFISRSTDGGVTWNRQNSGTGNNLYSVLFNGASEGWAVGDGGVVLRTTDGGSTWTADYISAKQNLRHISFRDARNYWISASEGVLFKSVDGGDSWESVLTGYTSVTFARIDFPSPTRGWAIGGKGIMIYSENSGQSWKQVEVPTSQFLYGMYFTDGLDGWLVGDGGTMLHTEDGGVSWETVWTGTSANINDIFFLKPGMGWAVGNGGVLLKYAANVVKGPTVTSVIQEIDEKGYVKLALKIERVNDPGSGQSRELPKGLMQVKASLDYDYLGLSVDTIRGVAPFENPVIIINNPLGRASFEVGQSELLVQPPVSLVDLFLNIKGPGDKPYNLSIDYGNITAGTGAEFPQEETLSLAFYRGDASGDGTINREDAMVIAKYLGREIESDGLNLLNAASIVSEHEKGNTITMKDAMFVAQRDAGIRNASYLPASGYWEDRLAGR